MTALGAIALGAVSGCGGGSSGSAIPQPAASTVQAPGPTTAAQRVVVTVKIPAASSSRSVARRAPLYVSPNTQSASIAVAGGTPTVVNLSASSPDCTAAGSARVCTTAVTAPVGLDTFAETLYAGLNATGAVLSRGQTSATIVAGQANTVTLALDGVIASLSLVLANAAPPVGTAATLGVTVNFNDASGASIIGNDPFVTPVALSDSDASGATTLSKTTLNTPADAAGLTLAYSGAPIAQAVIAASTGSVAAASATLTPVAPASTTFNDYPTFGYDNARDVFNPNTTTITPGSLPNLHLAWQASLNDFNTQTQPILATEIPGHAGVLFVGGRLGNVYGYDALTGAMLWKQYLGRETYTCENGTAMYFGIGGTAAYDPASRSLYVVGNSNSVLNGPTAVTLFRLDAASGAILGQVNAAPVTAGWPSLDFSHASVALSPNGLAYIGTGAICDESSWRGRVAAISVPAMSLTGTFFTVWDPQNTRGGGPQPWGGGGIWGWGGVALDPRGTVFTGVGNTDVGSTEHGTIVAPFVPAPTEYSGFGEAFLQLSPDLSTVEAANHPIPASLYSGVSADLDVNGTPVLFTPSGPGCDPMAALQSKSGTIYLYDRTRIGSGPVAQYALAPSSYADGFLGGPAYSSATGLLYVGVSSSNESLFAPGMIAIDPGCGNPSVAWHAAFGPDSYAPGSFTSPGEPRSVPAVSAGGVVFIGTICRPTGNSCGATGSAAATGAAVRGSTQRAVTKPLICCAPPGTGGGAVWAIDASSGSVLNGGNPVIITSGPLRMPPTIDGDWIYVLDNSGNLYGLTLDPHYAAISTTQHAVDARMLNVWERQPKS